MRALLWVVVIAALGVGLTLAAAHNRGYALLMLPPWRVEISLNFLIVLLLLAFAAGYALAALVRAEEPGLEITTLAYAWTFAPPVAPRAGDGVIVRVSGYGIRDQIRPALDCPCQRHAATPAGDLAVVPREQNLGNGPAAELGGAGVVGVFQQAGAVRLLLGRERAT